MALEARLATGLGLALIVAFCATPIAIRAAGRLDFYDKPVGYKGHAAPTPYLGGAAVVLAFGLALALFAGSWERSLPLLGGVLALWVVGTVDDRRQVSPLVRVLMEAGLATGIFALGQGWNLGSDPLSLVVTIAWVVAVVNAFNLFDNMDGAASSMAAVVCGAVAVLGVVVEDRWLAVAAIALTGACVGFLPHNLSPRGARIFLGDGGSMPIGFAVSVLVMSGTSAAAPEWQALAMGLMLVGVPALDTALVVVSRARRGISLLTGGRDHLTHRTRRLLQNARGVAIALGSVQIVISALAIVAVGGGSRAIVGAAALYLLSIGVAIVVLDTFLAPEAVAATAPADRAEDPPRARRTLPPSSRIGIVAILLGLGLGISPLFFGYYSPGLWVPGGLALVALAVAGGIAAPPRLDRPAVLLLAGLAGLGVWALVSTQWADSVEQAVVEGNRFLVYAALVAFVSTVLRSRSAALWVLGTVAACAVLLGLWTVGKMLAGDSVGLFLGARLNDPLGYVNGQGSYYVMAAWLLLGGAVWRRRPLAAGLAAGAATLVLSLVVLSQSRGVVLSLVASVVLVLALVPGRLRHAWALVVVGGATAAAAPFTLHVFAENGGGVVTDDATRSAALATLVAAVAGGALWAGAVALANRDALAVRLRRPAGAVLIAGVAVVLLVGVVRQETIRTTVADTYDGFVQVGATPETDTDGATASSRLGSGAGNRYDYWRIAWHTFEDAPVRGSGAGNYDRPYFRQRATTEDIRQPHSLPLQTLAELGLVGGALLLVCLAGVALGLRRTVRAARTSARARALAVGGGGAVTAWFAHTSVDWMHLLPGLTGVALVAACALVAAPVPADPARVAAPARSRPRLLSVLALAAVFLVAGISLSRQGLTEHYRLRAQGSLAQDPAKALREADRAVRLDPEAVAAYYVKAAALARFGEGPAARSVLLEAAEREPRRFLTWVLLGDLAVRTDDAEAARRCYGRALALNPRDPSLRRLAADPRPAGR